MRVALIVFQLMKFSTFPLAFVSVCVQQVYSFVLLFLQDMERAVSNFYSLSN